MKLKLFMVVLFLSILALVPALAEDCMASIGFTNNSQTQQYWGYDTDSATGKTALITGDGQYTISASFYNPIQDINCSYILIQNAEQKWPNSTIQITSVKIDGQKVNFTKGFTLSSDGSTTAMSLWDPWFDGFNPEHNPRSYDGVLMDPFVLKESDFIGANNIEVSFYFHAGQESHDPLAILAFTNKDETQAYWGTDSDIATGKTARITGDGLYTVSVSFARPIKDIYFSRIMIKDAEQLWPKGTIQVTSVTIDGKKVNFAKGFTFSDDHTTTILSLWDPWHKGFDYDFHPRSYDGALIKGSKLLLKRSDLLVQATSKFSFITVQASKSSYVFQHTETSNKRSPAADSLCNWALFYIQAFHRL